MTIAPCRRVGLRLPVERDQMNRAAVWKLLFQKKPQRVFCHPRIPHAHGQHVLRRIAVADSAHAGGLRVDSAGVSRCRHAVDRPPDRDHSLQRRIRKPAACMVQICIPERPDRVLLCVQPVHAASKRCHASGLLRCVAEIGKAVFRDSQKKADPNLLARAQDLPRLKRKAGLARQHRFISAIPAFHRGGIAFVPVGAHKRPAVRAEGAQRRGAPKKRQRQRKIIRFLPELIQIVQQFLRPEPGLQHMPPIVPIILLRLPLHLGQLRVGGHIQLPFPVCQIPDRDIPYKQVLIRRDIHLLPRQKPMAAALILRHPRRKRAAPTLRFLFYRLKRGAKYGLPLLSNV